MSTHNKEAAEREAFESDTGMSFDDTAAHVVEAREMWLRGYRSALTASEAPATEPRGQLQSLREEVAGLKTALANSNWPFERATEQAPAGEVPLCEMCVTPGTCRMHGCAVYPDRPVSTPPAVPPGHVTPEMINAAAAVIARGKGVAAMATARKTADRAIRAAIDAALAHKGVQGGKEYG